MNFEDFQNLNLSFALLETYLAMIKNSIGNEVFNHRNGTEMFKNVKFTRKKKGEIIDVTDNGNLSCAFFVAFILKGFNLIKNLRTSVDGLTEEMRECGWTEIQEPKSGAVIIWKKQLTNTGWHKHIGFYISDNQAISNSSDLKHPVKHPWKDDPNSREKRKIEKILWHTNLDLNIYG